MVYVAYAFLVLLFLFLLYHLIKNIKLKKWGWIILWLTLILILVGMIITMFGTTISLLN